MTAPKVDTLKVPGATIQYSVQGSGPVLLLIPGAPADSSAYFGLAGFLADKYTIVTYDPRGYGDSPLDGPAGDQQVEVHADDARRVLEAVTDEPADILACSGGALIALSLVASHPDKVRTLVAHEPPAVELLPDNAKWREVFQGVYDTYKTAGAGPAMGQFIVAVGGEPPDPSSFGEPTPEMLAFMERMNKNVEFFLAHALLPFLRKAPDVEAVKAAPTKVIVLGGEASTGQVAYDSAVALAKGLGTDVVTVPGDHQGFMTHTEGFATTVHKVLTDA